MQECCFPMRQVPAKMRYVWGFLGPHVYSDLKSSVRWNEQWQFIIVIKGKGSQKTSEAWKLSDEESHGINLAPWRQHPDHSILSSTDCVYNGCTGAKTCYWWGLVPVLAAVQTWVCASLTSWMPQLEQAAHQDACQPGPLAIHRWSPRTLRHTGYPCRHTHIHSLSLCSSSFSKHGYK